jgi:hypothetical protein
MAASQETTDGQMTEHTQEGMPIDRSAPIVGQWQPLAQVGQEEKSTSRLSALLIGIALLLGVGGLVIWQFQFLPAGGQIAAIERGALKVQTGQSDAWAEGQPGLALREGWMLASEPGAVVTLQFADRSICRVESAGLWQILELRRSRNGRIARTTLHQLAGQASYMSRPPQPAVDARLRVSLPGDVSLDLSGVATVTMDPAGIARIQLLQGNGQLRAWERDLGLSPGQTLVLDLQARSVGSE